MNLFVKVLGEHKGEKLDKVLHDYYMTKKHVIFYVAGNESEFEYLKDKRVLFKFTDAENEINLLFKGTVKLGCVCDEEDGRSGLYILKVSNLEQLNNKDN